MCTHVEKDSGERGRDGRRCFRPETDLEDQHPDEPAEELLESRPHAHAIESRGSHRYGGAAWPEHGDIEGHRLRKRGSDVSVRRVARQIVSASRMMIAPVEGRMSIDPALVLRNLVGTRDAAKTLRPYGRSAH
jgi:hypothetical protein